MGIHSIFIWQFYSGKKFWRKIIQESCGNCPYAGIKLNDTIQLAYGDRLVVVSVHVFCRTLSGRIGLPGFTANGFLHYRFSYFYRRRMGSQFWKFQCRQSEWVDRPCRISKSSTGKSSCCVVKCYSAAQYIGSSFALRIKNNYDASSREFKKIAVQSRAVSSMTGPFKLTVILRKTVWLTGRNGIRRWPEYDPDYIHRHVLLNGCEFWLWWSDWEATVNAGDIALRGYKITLNPAWEAKHMRIVAFISEEQSYEVKQVEASWIQ